MNALTIAVCDDDGEFRSILRPALVQAFGRCGVSVDLSEAESAGELSRLLAHRSFELIFLDIDMPGLDGIRLGERLRLQGITSDIIYLSNMEDRVYDIFRVHPWSFVRKSRVMDELGDLAEEYVRTRRAAAAPILLQSEDGSALPVSPHSLIYAEAAGKLQKLFFSDGSGPKNVRTSLRELEEMLLPHGFIRIHKGFLVNYRFIQKITSRSVILDAGEELPVGRDRLAGARERYLSLMKWKGLSHR